MDDRDTIKTLRKLHIDGFNARDVDAMAVMVADDVVTMPPHTPDVEGKEALRAWWQAGFDAAQAEFGFTPIELVVAGDWAIDRFSWSMDTTPDGGGERSSDGGACIWIWRKEPDGSWRLARAIWNSDREAPGVWSGASRD